MRASDQRFEFKRDPKNGCLIGPDGCHHDSEAHAMYFGLVASCGCGDPEGVHAFLVECLKQFTGNYPKPSLDGVKKLILEDPDTAAEFIAHYLTGEGFMEHGFHVMGSWLTPRGEQFVEIGPWVDDEE